MIRVRKNSKYPNSIINFSGFKQRRKYSMLPSESLINESLPNKYAIQPWFVTGFVDGDGCFVVSIYKSDKNKIGWQVNVNFRITLHKKDVELLKLLQAYFNGVGWIKVDRGDDYVFSVGSTKEILSQIIPHFDKYPLKTQKQAPEG